ncbi:MAG: hypothetical protein PHR68_02925 [Candidatus Gracilibacteria bacterium]|nr:hypothetical protein [Candidatus Gracilibacteria bacterium]
MNNTLEALTKAIKEKKVIEFDYKLEGTRLGNSHAIYRHIKTRNILLDLYQTKGYSSSNENIPGWREFDINEISKINILSEVFNVANGYNRNSERYNNYIAKI